MEMQGKERFIIRTGGRFQQVLPKYRVFFPSRSQLFRVIDPDPVQLENCELRDLCAHAWRHTEEQVGRPGQGAAEMPDLQQKFSHQRLRLDLIDEDRSDQWNSGPCVSSGDPLPPVKTFEVQVEQEYRTAPDPFARALIDARPERRFTIDGATLERGVLRLSDTCQHSQAPCIQSVQCWYCPQTGPPIWGWCRAIPTHIPIRCCGIGGGFSLGG